MKSLMRIAALGLCSCAVIWAQGTAQIHGTVRDTSGAAVAGAAVKATQTDTGIARAVATETDGSFALPDLPLGPYKLEVNKEGFSPEVQTGIVLQVGSDPAVPISPEVGAVTQTVNIVANAELVETRSTAVGQVVDNARILDLPLNGRNVTDLVLLAGAAMPGTPAANSLEAPCHSTGRRRASRWRRIGRRRELRPGRRHAHQSV